MSVQSGSYTSSVSPWEHHYLDNFILFWFRSCKNFAGANTEHVHLKMFIVCMWDVIIQLKSHPAIPVSPQKLAFCSQKEEGNRSVWKKIEIALSGLCSVEGRVIVCVWLTAAGELPERQCHTETRQTHSCRLGVMSVSVRPTPALKQTQVTLAGAVVGCCLMCCSSLSHAGYICTHHFSQRHYKQIQSTWMWGSSSFLS